MKDDRLYLSNIKECIERIDSYTVDGKGAFLQTPMVQDAVIRNFEIIGESMGCDRARFTWFKGDCRVDFAGLGMIQIFRISIKIGGFKSES
jgi:hypothetical protein